MCVWIVNPFDNLPMEGYRPQRYWLMARAFAAKGHDVVYWTSDFSHASKRKRALINEANDGFAVRFVPGMPYPVNVCIRRAVSHWRLARTWKRLAENESVRPDVVIASMPPLGLCDAARMFALNSDAMFVADIQDAWPETFERILPRCAFSLLGMCRTAKRIYCGADGISAVAGRYVELSKKYGSVAPSSVFGHCIDMSVGPAVRSRDAGTLRLAYAGNMSLSYDLATVVRAVSGMKGVTLDIAGSGPDRKNLCDLSSNAGNIIFHDYLDESHLSDLLSRCDIGLVPMFPDSCVGVPGKLADYAAAGLQIIESLGGETRALVERFDVGVHYEAGNVDSLRKAVETMRGKKPCGRFDAFAAEFDASRIMPQYVDWIEGLVRFRMERG